MAERKTKKKVTRVKGGKGSAAEAKFVPTDESRKKSKMLRVFAWISFIVAIGFEVGAIFALRESPVNMTELIILIALTLVFAVVGSQLWKKANRLDPASEKNKFKFFVQNQLGLIIAVIAFLPLVILIFTNKNLKGKQKGLLGAIAIGALLIASLTGVDFNPPSQEQYLEQTQQVEMLNNGRNFVYWTKYGSSYHILSLIHI